MAVISVTGCDSQIDPVRSEFCKDAARVIATWSLHSYGDEFEVINPQIQKQIEMAIKSFELANCDGLLISEEYMQKPEVVD